MATAGLTLAFAACGGDDKPTATSCLDDWNADGNAGYQSIMAGTNAVDIILDGAFRVGTWPKGEQTVPVLNAKDGFSDKASGRASVAKNSCLVVYPPTREGAMAFFESDGKWHFARDIHSKFPKEAQSAVAGARAVTPDALGKLKLK
ncbi:MAG TPA: hypothetical protein VF066_10400 [Thermoleophilaceae bacterium]